MKYSLSLLLGVTVLMTSCKKEQTTSAGDSRQVVPFTQQGGGIQSQDLSSEASQNHNLFRENNNNAASSSVASAVNPEHGQPNHRCDIPVGAPLNTGANGSGQSQATTVSSTPVQSNTQAPVVQQVTPKGMNPPHGEKNHRCDIAVGAPLNSKATIENTVVAQDQNGASALPALLSTDK
jgi:hypothetical protein